MQTNDQLNQFLSSVERRALRMAEIATKHREDALDIVQEAMCKLVERYRQRPAQEWGPLFQRILQSKIRDYYRRTKVRNTLRVWLGQSDINNSSADAMDTLADTRTPSPARQFAHDQALVKLEQALQQLPLRQQQVFLLRVWEGFDVAQTAQAMACSQGSVKTHYSRALQKLRKILSDDWS